jgi:hypothetical protein
MKSMKSAKSALMLSMLAIGGVLALAAPASADDYDNHGVSSAQSQPAPWFFEQTANNQVRAPRVNAAQAAPAVQTEAARRAQLAAQDEARRLQQ